MRALLVLLLLATPVFADDAEFSAERERARTQTLTLLLNTGREGAKAAPKTDPFAPTHKMPELSLPKLPWYTDLSAAGQEAKKEHKYLLVWVGAPDKAIVAELAECVHVAVPNYDGSPAVVLRPGGDWEWRFSRENLTAAQIRRFYPTAAPAPTIPAPVAAPRGVPAGYRMECGPDGCHLAPITSSISSSISIGLPQTYVASPPTQRYTQTSC